MMRLQDNRPPNLVMRFTGEDGKEYLGSSYGRLKNRIVACPECGRWGAKMRDDPEFLWCSRHKKVRLISVITSEIDGRWMPLWKKLRGVIANRLAWLIAAICVAIVVAVGFTSRPATWTVQRPQQCAEMRYAWYREDGEGIVCLKGYQAGAKRSE